MISICACTSIHEYNYVYFMLCLRCLEGFIQTLKDLTAKIRSNHCLHYIQRLQREMGCKITSLCVALIVKSGHARKAHCPA